MYTLESAILAAEVLIDNGKIKTKEDFIEYINMFKQIREVSYLFQFFDYRICEAIKK